MLRQSHPLEGSSQEAIPLPSTTFDFFPLCSTGHTPPPLGHRRRIHVFIPLASTPMRRTSHPSGSRPRDVSQLRQTSAPGIVDAPENPRFPAVSNRVQRTDHLAPLRVQLVSGSRQRRRTIGPCSGRPYGMGEDRDKSDRVVVPKLSPQPPASTRRWARPQPKAFVAS